ncbi:hypothetical protein RZE82_04285 [Mollicutes bacterium LVI A0039]|nr:hypothetical protein RZE82_04285 [Mollicutes bacterium LVI A0039]
MNKTLKRVLIAFLGINLLSIGLMYILAIDFGVGPFDSLTLALQGLLGIDKFSNASFALHGLFFILLLFLVRGFKIRYRDVIISLFSIFIVTRIISIYEEIIKFDPSEFSTIIVVIVFIVAFLTLNLGLYFMAISNIIIPPYDKFVVEFSKYKNIELGKSRLIADALVITLVIALNVIGIVSVTVSIGTIIITLFTGLNITLYNKLISYKGLD